MFDVPRHSASLICSSLIGLIRPLWLLRTWLLAAAAARVSCRDGRGTTVPMREDRHIAPSLLRQIARDLGLPVEELLRNR
jgi:hypothetical protein